MIRSTARPSGGPGADPQAVVERARILLGQCGEVTGAAFAIHHRRAGDVMYGHGATGAPRARDLGAEPRKRSGAVGTVVVTCGVTPATRQRSTLQIVDSSDTREDPWLGSQSRGMVM